MGEMARFKGEEVKIGTCEDMYYLRADQRELVKALPHNVDPVNDADVLRFRFPFPDEDKIEPGAFENSFRSVVIPGATPPEGVEHDSMQFRHDKGYLISLPCPEAGESPVYGMHKVHRNGFAGAVKLCQQRFFNGFWVPVFECGGCGAKWRIETLEECQPIIKALRDEAETARCRPTGLQTANWYDAIADRIVSGFAKPEGK